MLLLYLDNNNLYMYKCKTCENTSFTKLWKCPLCWWFWTFIEIIDKKNNYKTHWKILNKIENNEINFYKIKNNELERVFYRWIKQWWLYLIWWEPWIWKSTIVLQILFHILYNNNVKIWYFSWEENADQILDRWNRLNRKEIDNIDILYSNNIEDIIETSKNNKYDIIIIDSIQTVHTNKVDSSAWSISQVKFCSELISEYCKEYKITWIIIWHVTKSWEIAWPKYLEHLVDVVTYLEWEKFWNYRLLRNKKNRFSWTDEVAIFEMTEKWLISVENLNKYIINWSEDFPWSILTIWLEDSRPIIVNLEVLINKTKFKFPERKSIWVDWNRLNMIIAILERYLKINFWYYDIYINIPWEFKFYESWIDLAIAIWLLSQMNNIVVNKDQVFIWEIWLWWQILKSRKHEKRINEANWLKINDFKNIKNVKDLKLFI